MQELLSLILSFFLITVLNIVLYVSSRKLNKKIKWQHFFFGYMFLLYLMIALVLVVGFPNLHSWARLIRNNRPLFNPNINLIPFKDGFEISTILNIVFFMPFGFLLPALWEKYNSLKKTLFLALIFSITIEVGQLFMAIRATDINDLIMNGVGAILGYLLYKFLKSVFYKYDKEIVTTHSHSDTLVFKVEPYMYIVIAVVSTFFII